LQGLFAFRAPVESALRGATWPKLFGAWRPTFLCHHIAADLAELGLSPCMYDDQPPRLQTTADFLGVAYVLEGATLEAQVLVRSVQPLGLSGSSGARHLLEQVAALRNWKRLTEILEDAQDAEGADIERTIRVCNTVLYAAEYAMARVEGDRVEADRVPAAHNPSSVTWAAPRLAAE